MAQSPKSPAGARFAALTQELAKRRGVKNPRALAAFIGRKKLGGQKMATMAAKGRKVSMRPDLDNDGN